MTNWVYVYIIFFSLQELSTITDNIKYFVNRHYHVTRFYCGEINKNPSIYFLSDWRQLVGSLYLTGIPGLITTWKTPRNLSSGGTITLEMGTELLSVDHFEPCAQSWVVQLLETMVQVSTKV